MDALTRSLSDPVVCVRSPSPLGDMVRDWALVKGHLVKVFREGDKEMLDYAAERRPAFCVWFTTKPQSTKFTDTALARAVVLKFKTRILEVK